MMVCAMSQLTAMEYQLLNFISTNEPVKFKEIADNFSKLNSVELRLRHLSTGNPPYIKEDGETHIDAKGRESYAPLKIYSATDFGRMVLQDYVQERKAHKKSLWIMSAGIPILVSVLANLIISSLKWLLPLIQKL